MNSKYPRMNLRYVEDDEIDELSELYLRICDSGDSDKIAFIRFYFYLVNYRVENGRNEDFPICSEKIWPHINYSKTAFKKSIFEHNETELLKVKEFILDNFEKSNKNYLKNVNNKYFTLLKKVSKSKAIQIEHQVNCEYAQENPEYGYEFNNVWMSLELIRIRTYASALMESILQEERKDRRNFLLGLFLGAVGMLASIIFGLLPLLV